MIMNFDKIEAMKNENNAFSIVLFKFFFKKIKKLIGKPEATRMDFYVHCADEHLKKIKLAGLETELEHIIVDAYFANEKFADMTLKNNCNVVSKLRCDANLRHINTEKNVGPGRPKKYAGKVEVKNVKSFTFVSTLNHNTTLYEGIFYSINLKCKIKVACLVFTHKKTIYSPFIFYQP